jgi:hypothetical protein
MMAGIPSYAQTRKFTEHPENKATMKTTIYTLILMFFLNAGMLIAGNSKNSAANPSPAITETLIDIHKLAPATPGEAEFADGTDFLVIPAAYNLKLAPSVPKEADFEETDLPLQADARQLSPSAPAETDFEDTTAVTTDDSSALAPATPPVADFNEE